MISLYQRIHLPLLRQSLVSDLQDLVTILAFKVRPYLFTPRVMHRAPALLRIIAFEKEEGFFGADPFETLHLLEFVNEFGDQVVSAGLVCFRFAGLYPCCRPFFFRQGGDVGFEDGLLFDIPGDLSAFFFPEINYCAATIAVVMEPTDNLTVTEQIALVTAAVMGVPRFNGIDGIDGGG